MKSTTTTSNALSWTTLSSRFFSAPIELRSFLVFSTAVSLFQLSFQFLFGLGTIKESIIPITGWLMAQGYIFTLFFIFSLVFFSGTAGQRIRFRLAVVALLAINVLYGIYGIPFYGDNDYGNPYLIISKWRPVWTIVLPSFWMVLLMSKRVTAFCKAPELVDL